MISHGVILILFPLTPNRYTSGTDRELEIQKILFIKMTAKTEKKPGKLMGVVGAVCGLLLYYLWVAVIMAILFTFFAEPTAMGVFKVAFPLMARTWLIAGTLPFFIIFGHYLFTREPMSEAELLLDRSGLAASASGFLLWLAVLVVLEVLGVTVAYPYYVAGGYLVILILFVCLRKAWSRGA